MSRAAMPADDRTPRIDRPGRLLALRHDPGEVAALGGRIYQAALARSETLRTGNFTILAVNDLRLLFELYDADFFGGLLGQMLREDVAGLTFRLSNRMTRVAGTTTMHKEQPRAGAGARGGATVRSRYEIAVSTVLLFNTFREAGRVVNVGGLPCRDRLDALQRTFEHELLHLAEFLAWGRSSCSEENFHRLSRQIFGHEGVRHELVTPRETAALQFDIRVGDLVAFEFEGVRRTGRVNRITKRATVLVEDARGPVFTDGKRYATFYVPVALLKKQSLL